MSDIERSYHGTRGYSEPSASRDAAEAEAASGKTSAMMAIVLEEVRSFGAHGLTSAELRKRIAGEHHGRITSALTKLHIAGALAALRDRRDNCGVYVVPEYVLGRETRSYRRQMPKRSRGIIVEVLEGHRPWPTACGCGWRPGMGETVDEHIADEIIEALTAP